MSRITVTGALPGVILSNSAAGSWAGTLSLSGDVADVSGLSLSGYGASFFSVQYDAVHDLAVISPSAKVSYSALIALGMKPELDFSLVVSFGDGTSETEAPGYAITVQNVDDTPPSALAFSSGGSATAGALGAVIGTLHVTDNFTTGPFYYSFSAADAWKYQVVGNTLMLQSGYSYSLDDVGLQHVPIDVSDGVQSAAFNLSIVVNAPGGQPDLVTMLSAGQTIDGFYINAVGSVTTGYCSCVVSYIENYGNGVHALMLTSGQAVWLPGTVTQIHFSDGWIDLRPANVGEEVEALYRTILQRDADTSGYWNWTSTLASGSMTFLQMTQQFLSSPEYVARIGNPDNATFLTDLYRDAFGRAPDANGYATNLAKLQGGMSRAQLVDAFLVSAEALNLMKKLHADGYWIAEPNAKNVAMIYEVALSREPDTAGLQNWVTQLTAGAYNLKTLSYQFGASPEFLSQFATMSNSDFVTAMYENALHRAPDATGLANWTAKLDAGTATRSDMVYNFAFSAENVNNHNLKFAGLDLFFH